MSPGKQAAEREAAAPMAAGARLEAMRRRVRLSRLAVWTVIAAGPIALGIAITSSPTTVEAAAPAKPAGAARTTAVAADPAGYAQLFVNAWLRSSADDARVRRRGLRSRWRRTPNCPTRLRMRVHSRRLSPSWRCAVRSARTARGR